MIIHQLHKWDVTVQEAIAIQKKLADRCVFSCRIPQLVRIAGADISYNKNTNILYAVVIVLSYPAMEIIELQQTKAVPQFPYIPGLLSFREVPPLLECFEMVRNVPDVVMCDGQGYAHPRRFGLACHLGVLLNIPTIGCAKSRLTGEGVEPTLKRGSISPLYDRGEEIGQIVRTKDNVKPMYISSGNLISLSDAVHVALLCSTKYRIPEPTRKAHCEVNKLRIAHL
jgi:deoxyribonuclease V